MKIHTLYKKALISMMGLAIVLNCTSQTPKEKNAARNEKRRSEYANNSESLNSMIQSRHFVFRSRMEENGQVSTLYERNGSERCIIKINGPLARINGLNSSEWWKTTSCRIDKWETTENPEELAHAISFIARSGESNTTFLMKVLHDKTAIVQFGGREFRGQITSN